jgi:beta-lactamase class D
MMFKSKRLRFSVLAGNLLFLQFSALATDQCLKESEENKQASGFVAKQGNRVIQKDGRYEDRHAPFSTFKIALAYMGFAEGILKSKDSPTWAFKEDYEKNLQDWYTRKKGLELDWCQDQTPATYMKNSVIWFSHQITQRLGKKKFQDYATKLNYGNQDVSGTPGKDDGLLNAWLGTSLQISPTEHVAFLEKLFTDELDKSAREKTREIMDREENWNGWKLYGKTGGGKMGWFVGWVEKGDQRIFFAQYLDLGDPGLNRKEIPIQKTMGLTAKEVAKKKILPLLKQ